MRAVLLKCRSTRKAEIEPDKLRQLTESDPFSTFNQKYGKVVPMPDRPEFSNNETLTISLRHRAWQFILSIGIDPEDDIDTRLQKSLLVICACFFIFAGFLWGVLYYVLGQPLAGSIPFSYAVFSFASIVYFGFSHHYAFFKFSQLILILLLPFILMWTLGGFTSGSGVILWSLICPIGALLFEKPQRAV